MLQQITREGLLDLTSYPAFLHLKSDGGTLKTNGFHTHSNGSAIQEHLPILEEMGGILLHFKSGERVKAYTMKGSKLLSKEFPSIQALQKFFA